MTESVVRVGDTVRRPPGPNAQLGRDVLLHLERTGFDAAPRWLGVDAQGRDMLSWIEGETFADRSRLHPYIGDPPERVAFSDEQLVAVFALLRRYHDSFREELVCHGDFGPWNLVWHDGLPVALIDFDQAHAGDAAEDVAYALRMFVSYGFADAEPWRARTAHAPRARRVRPRLRRAGDPRTRVRLRRGALPRQRLAPPARQVARRACLAHDKSGAPRPEALGASLPAGIAPAGVYLGP